MLSNWWDGSNTVTELSSSGITIGTYSVGILPGAIAIDKAGYTWVSNNADNTITKLGSGITVGTYAVGEGPKAIAVDNSGNIWVVNDDTVTELSSTGTIIATYSAGLGPSGIAIDSSGNVWVTNYGDNTVTEIMGVASGPQYWPYTGPQWP